MATCIYLLSITLILYICAKFIEKHVRQEEFQRKNKHKIRWIILLTTAFLMIGTIVLYWTPIINFLGDNQKKIPSTLITAIFISPFAFWLWLWRDQNKIKDQNQKEEELQQTGRELKMKENNDAWDNFFKFQRIAIHKEELTRDKASAVYALGEYYLKPIDSNFPQQVHECFKALLEHYWQKNKPSKITTLRSDIIAIHNVIKQKSCVLYEKKLKLDNFMLCNAYFRGAQISELSFVNADLRGADLSLADLEGTNFKEADLRGTKINYPKCNELACYQAKYNKDTQLEGVKLSSKVDMKYIEEEPEAKVPRKT
jgi:Pentapeptide repeats (8 copies)